MTHFLVLGPLSLLFRTVVVAVVVAVVVVVDAPRMLLPQLLDPSHSVPHIKVKKRDL